MSLITPDQKRRLNNINNILKNYKEPDIPDRIIEKIRKKFPTVKNYDFLQTEQINEYDLIQTVDLNLKKLSIVGKCIKINYSQTRAINSILLHNIVTDTFWKINPEKYYIFKVLSNNDNELRENIENLYNILNNKENKDNKNNNVGYFV